MYGKCPKDFPYHLGWGTPHAISLCDQLFYLSIWSEGSTLILNCVKCLDGDFYYLLYIFLVSPCHPPPRQLLFPAAPPTVPWLVRERSPQDDRMSMDGMILLPSPLPMAKVTLPTGLMSQGLELHQVCWSNHRTPLRAFLMKIELGSKRMGALWIWEIFVGDPSESL